MTDHPFTITHHDERRHDYPSAVDAEITIPRGHVGSLAELVAKADAYDAINESLSSSESLCAALIHAGIKDYSAREFRKAVREIIRRERAARINHDITTAEAPPQLVADGR